MPDCSHMTVREIVQNKMADLRKGICCGCDIPVGAFRAYEENGRAGVHLSGPMPGKWGGWTPIEPDWVSFFHDEGESNGDA